MPFSEPLVPTSEPLMSSSYPSSPTSYLDDFHVVPSDNDNLPVHEAAYDSVSETLDTSRDTNSINEMEALQRKSKKISQLRKYNQIALFAHQKRRFQESY